ncbi:hypothetical protein SAMN05216490_3246 [Mucilaginibacter mallensis]|uniref:Uncharacterized protein n=1 Tax=Mucilaginibacter mallensis TaxID=652787 RepID=A0A1H1ZTN5_MUCMA|nr:hypothetical protein [Mucilaginibacter mallensis]SDT37068.1 hypothetical protein SAMN05216490_3246 [Mucilaginibacter mallensis]
MEGMENKFQHFQEAIHTEELLAITGSRSATVLKISLLTYLLAIALLFLAISCVKFTITVNKEMTIHKEGNAVYGQVEMTSEEVKNLLTGQKMVLSAQKNRDLVVDGTINAVVNNGSTYIINILLNTTKGKTWLTGITTAKVEIKIADEGLFKKISHTFFNISLNK